MKTAQKNRGQFQSRIAKDGAGWSLYAIILGAILFCCQESQVQAGIVLTPIIYNGVMVNDPYVLEQQKLLSLYYNHPNRLLQQQKSRIIWAARQRRLQQQHSNYIWWRDSQGNLRSRSVRATPSPPPRRMFRYR